MRVKHFFQLEIHIMVKIIDEPSYREKKFVFKDRFQAGKILAEKLGKTGMIE
jgi:hypothetical protein